MADERGTRLAQLEVTMGSPDFWADRMPQKLVQEYQHLKEGALGRPARRGGNATLAMTRGRGRGDDAEDFARMLRRMYEGYAGRRGWRVRELHSNENDHGGYRNVMLEISRHRRLYCLRHERSGAQPRTATS